MARRNLQDHTGKAVETGAKLGQGGEGAVFEIAGAPDLVAKLYHKPAAAEKADKLRAMVRLADAELLKVAAWPVATLHDSANGPVVGVTLPRVKNAREIHTLYSPAHRKQLFPRADWAFLAHTAMNCATVFDVMHAKGHVLGDVNQSNLLVAPNALVTLIDCDSYQIRDGGRVFLCEVGVPQYTPPELQGMSFRGVERTPNHDRFGLAVLIFHLLLMGRHPFAGRFLGSGEMPLEQAIREYRFAFSRTAADFQMAPPPHSITLSSLSPGLARLFERAFSKHSSKPDARPAAAEWVQALDEFKRQLRPCPSDPGHRVPAHLTACPWCEVMQQGSPNFFATVALFVLRATGPGGAFDLEAIWRQIEQVAAPRVAYQRPAPSAPVQPTPLPPDLPPPPPPYVPTPLPPYVSVPRDFTQRAVGRVALVALAASVGGCVIGARTVGTVAVVVSVAFALWWLALEVVRRSREVLRNVGRVAALQQLRREQRQRQQQEEAWRRAVGQEKKKRRQALKSAETALAKAETHWQQQAAHYANEFVALRTRLGQCKAAHQALAAEFDAAIAGLEKNLPAMQKNAFLQTHYIADADIPKIGPSREAVLRSYGIETAFDVSEQRIDDVPGFGPALTKNLLDWRKQVEKQFRFDPSQGIPETELHALKRQFDQRRLELEDELRKGPEALRTLAAQAENHLAQLLVGVQQRVDRLAQAAADYSVTA